MGPAVVEENEFTKDPKYRGYINAIDKALRSFEYTSEWADLISALGKLNKVLQSYTKYPVLGSPRTIKIGKRLAQCMHPALPSGVHLKALETYDIVLRSMGTDRLSQELFLYSAGLFPLLGYAATNVKSSLLAIYETHFVPLGEKLEPCLSGFLSGVLPGLEEGSDHFDRTNSLLEKVCDGVTPVLFYGNLWKCIATNSAVRLPAILYILSHFDKNYTVEDQLYIMGCNVTTMVNGLCECFHDSSVLVQRNALDFLMVAFPMHNCYLLRSDMQRLVTSALVTVLKRDMSLNRRLFSWLLGSEINTTMVHLEQYQILNKTNALADGVNHYFELYSRRLLINAVKCILHDATGQNPHDLRPCRILISLLDKADIGPIILDEILFEVFRLLYLCSKSPGKEATNGTEFMKNANLLLGSLEPRYLWHYAGMLFLDACQYATSECVNNGENVRPVGHGQPTLLEVCDLVSFLLETFSLEIYSESLNKYLQELFLHITSTLNDHCDSLSAVQTSAALVLCSQLLSYMKLLLPLSSTDVRHVSLSSIDQLLNSKNKSFNLNEIWIKLCNNNVRKEENSAHKYSNGFSSNIKGNRTIENVQSSDCDTDFVNSDSLSSKQESTNTAFISQQTLVEKCLVQYEGFFVTFMYGIYVKIGETKNVLDLFEMLVVPSVDISIDGKTKHLEQILQLVLQNHNISKQIISFSHDYDLNANNFIKMLQSKQVASLDWAEPVSYACKLLLKISLLQISTSSDADLKTSSTTTTLDDVTIPNWLKALVVCACWLGNFSISLQLAAIETFLDISSVCHQTYLETSDASFGNFIVPILQVHHLDFLKRNTNVFQIIAHWLWIHLESNVHQLYSAKLLYRLQNMLHYTEIVENCIGETLACKDVSQYEQLVSVRKFSLLWHLGKNITSGPDGITEIHDIFYRSMFKILDNLQLDAYNSLKVETEDWLLRVLLNNDVQRLMDPILMILLDPITARVSIWHAKMRDQFREKSNSPNVLLKNKRIYIRFNDGGIVQCVREKLPSPGSRIKNPNERKHVAGGDAMENKENGINQVDNSSGYFSGGFGDKSPDVVNHREESSNCNHVSDGCVKNDDLSSLDSAKRSSMSLSSLTTSSADLNFPSVSESLNSKADSGISVYKSRNFFSSEGLSLQEEKSSYDINEELIRSWSFSGKRLSSCSINMPDNSKNSKDVMSQNISVAIVSEILDSVVSEVNKKMSQETICSTNTRNNSNNNNNNNNNSGGNYSSNGQKEVKKDNNRENHLVERSSSQNYEDISQSYILLYCNAYDSLRTLYIFQTVRGILSTNSREFLVAVSSTKIPKHSELLRLFIRHSKSISAKGFYNNSTDNNNDNDDSSLRSSESITYLEVIVLVSLYYARSYYPNLGNSKVTRKEISGNAQVQLCSIELLTKIVVELGAALCNCECGLLGYLPDLLSRCKIQEVVLNCLFSNVNKVGIDRNSFIENVLLFNSEEQLPEQTSAHLETWHIHLLRLLHSLIVLEYKISSQKESPVETVPVVSDASNPDYYVQNNGILHQPMFLAVVTKILEFNPAVCHLHRHWLSLIVSSLPYFNRSCMKIITNVVKCVCNNVESFLEVCSNVEDKTKSSFPADYIAVQLEALMVVCHYSTSSLIQPSSKILLNITGKISLTTRLLSSPVCCYSSVASVKDSDATEAQECARESLLNCLTPIMFCIADLWRVFTAKPKGNRSTTLASDTGVIGDTSVVKNLVIQLLNPIAYHHGPAFLTSLAIVWHKQKKSTHVQKYILTEPTASQSVLLNLLSVTKSMGVKKLVETIHRVVKQPPNLEDDMGTYVEISLLELLLRYMSVITVLELLECGNELFSLLKDVSSVSAQAQFLLFSIFGLFVERSYRLHADNILIQKRQKDIQDITYKLVELLSQIAGAGLEQTTWLRRNLAVRDDETSTTSSSILSLAIKDSEKSGSSNVAQYSTVAQTMLAQLLLPLLDTVFGCHEKERVVTILGNLMINVVPYLKNHTQKNVENYYACSKLIVSISGYSYTRKAWRKDIMDLLLDSSFFQVEVRTLSLWKTIIDNLMSQDIATFRDLLGRVSVSQGNTLNLFSSREQEYEQRASLLKRLAFVIFCSEQDQFHKQMPDIQEKLADSLKLSPAAPVVQAQVFLCFRVLLLRMTPYHVTSLWPTIVTEMIQVLLRMESDLSSDVDGASHNETQQSIGNIHWLQLQLATAKLLKLALQLPVDRLPQFQMYRWAFIGSLSNDKLKSSSSSSQQQQHTESTDFVPHVVRIAAFMNKKFGGLSDTVPTLTLPAGCNIQSLQELYQFFSVLSQETSEINYSLSDVELETELDFVELIPVSR